MAKQQQQQTEGQITEEGKALEQATKAKREARAAKRAEQAKKQGTTEKAPKAPKVTKVTTQPSRAAIEQTETKEVKTEQTKLILKTVYDIGGLTFTVLPFLLDFNGSNKKTGQKFLINQHPEWLELKNTLPSKQTPTEYKENGELFIKKVQMNDSNRSEDQYFIFLKTNKDMELTLTNGIKSPYPSAEWANENGKSTLELIFTNTETIKIKANTLLILGASSNLGKVVRMAKDMGHMTKTYLDGNNESYRAHFKTHPKAILQKGEKIIIQNQNNTEQKESTWLEYFGVEFTYDTYTKHYLPYKMA